MAGAISLRELAEHLGREVEGNGETALEGVASLESAGPTDLCFVRDAQYAEALAASKAGAVILPHGLDAGGRPALRSPNPGHDFARAVAHLRPDPRPEPGIHPAAVVEPGARVDATASVGANAVVGAGSVVGARSTVHPNATVDAEVVVGDDCTIHSGCVVRRGTRLGDRVILQPCAVVGGDGFGYAPDASGTPQKVPQVGGVVVGDDVEIGAGSTIDRGALDDTRIGRGTKIDNLVQIGHNCVIGEDVLIVAQSGLSGRTVVGDGAILMAQSGFANGAKVGERAFIAARGGVTRDVEPGARIGGFPQLEFRRFNRVTASLLRLPELVKRVRAIERKLGLRGRGEEDAERGE